MKLKITKLISLLLGYAGLLCASKNEKLKKYLFISVKAFVVTLGCILMSSCVKQKNDYMATYLYEISDSVWNEAFGNHRAILQIENPCEVADLSFEWRRPDVDVDKKRFLIIHAKTGDTIQNIKRVHVDSEVCKISFGPIQEAGEYYFYYLPYQVQPGHGMYYKGYEPKEKEPDFAWNNSIASVIHTDAIVKKVQSRTAFDSFFPMEICAKEAELENYISQHKKHFYLFPEDRKYPIRMKKAIPYKWITDQHKSEFTGTALQNEYYTFQLALWSPKDSLEDIQYIASNLISDKDTIYSKNITCFNLEGIDPYGVAFTKKIGVPAKHVQPLWMGIDIPEVQTPGAYKGEIKVSDAKGDTVVVPINIIVKKELLVDRGDSEPWRHSRLRWLNSTLGLEHTPTTGYTPLHLNENRISCLGREITIDEASLLPSQIKAWDNDLLAEPINFIIETNKGVKHIDGVIKNSSIESGHIEGVLIAEDEDLWIEAKGIMEFDGWINYNYTLKPKKELIIRDVRIELPVKSKEAPLFMGMGLAGQSTPNKYSGKWNAPEITAQTYGASLTTSKQEAWLWPFDSFWLGSAKSGIHCELRGSEYSGPLLNLYRPAYPASWHNEGKGGFKIDTQAGITKATVYSGARSIAADSTISFEFALLITPVKPVNTQSQFKDRYYHNGGKPVPTEEDVEAGVKVINIHHANEYNPYINYPFLTCNKMRQFVEDWHKKECKIKLYYTVRELTNAAVEIWALRSLGNEILGNGEGGGFPWCREHFVTDYTPQWYQHFDHIDELGLTADASILTSTGETRWYNYYVEGLAWMVKNMDIDGIYLDDVAFDRRILQRMRRAMDSVKEGCVIDLHSNTGFSKGPAMQYAEFFPYVDKLWFGESFIYNKMSPKNWLVESSGIPFELMGDMLHAGGNKWLGMQYGMTVRHPWLTEGVICDPRVIWKIWDDFDIENAKMIGFWEADLPIKTGDNDIKATVYVHENKLLVSLGNYSDNKKSITLSMNKTGEFANFSRCIIPAIPDFQEERICNINETLQIPARQGLLLYLEQ